MHRKPVKAEPITLRGKKVFLRPPRTSDFQEYACLIKASAKTYRDLVPPFKGKKQFEDYLDRCRREDAEVCQAVARLHRERV